MRLWSWVGGSFTWTRLTVARAPEGPLQVATIKINHDFWERNMR